MQYNGKKDTLEIFNETWKVNHRGNLPSEKKINNNDMSFKVNKPNTGIRFDNQKKPIGYNNMNRNSGFHG